jgi:outer membrane protein TolC
MLELLVTQRDEARLQIDAADAAYRGGRGTQVDVFAARAAVAQIDDRIAEAEREVVTARTQLARWVGDAAVQPLGEKPALDVVRLDPAELDTALTHHPGIAVMAQREAVARADANVAQAGKKPDWSAGLMFSQRGSSYSNMVSINFSIPLQWDQKNRQDRELAAKLALADQARDEREEATREHVAEARMMLQTWQGDRERLARYDGSLIPLAQERMRAALAAYRGGAGALAPVLDARRGEIDVRMERLRLEISTARLWVQLNYLIPADHVTAASRP